MKLRIRSRLRLLSILQANGLQSHFLRKKPEATEECVCKNCGKHYIGYFCPQCGQKRNTRRLSFLNMIEDALSLLTNFDNGILRSITELLWRPGYMVRDYIEGKRKDYMKPLSLLFCLSTFYYVFVWLVAKDSLISLDNDAGDVNLPEKLMKYKPLIQIAKDFFVQWLNNPGLVTLTFILPMAPAAKFSFRKTRLGKVFNMMEHLHIQVFWACQMLIITILSGLANYIIHGHLDYLQFSFSFCFLIFVWDYKQLFELNWKKTFKLTLFSFLLSALLIPIIITLVVIIGIAIDKWY